jgi:hypothetical protein
MQQLKGGVYGATGQASSGTGLKTLQAAIQQSARDVERLEQRMSDDADEESRGYGGGARRDSRRRSPYNGGGGGNGMSQQQLDEQVSSRLNTTRLGKPLFARSGQFRSLIWRRREEQQRLMVASAKRDVNGRSDGRRRRAESERGGSN